MKCSLKLIAVASVPKRWKIVHLSPFLALHFVVWRDTAPKLSKNAWEYMPVHRAKFNTEQLLCYTHNTDSKKKQLTYKHETVLTSTWIINHHHYTNITTQVSATFT